MQSRTHVPMRRARVSTVHTQWVATAQDSLQYSIRRCGSRHTVAIVVTTASFIVRRWCENKLGCPFEDNLTYLFSMCLMAAIGS
jgi:hypothetical protein